MKNFCMLSLISIMTLGLITGCGGNAKRSSEPVARGDSDRGAHDPTASPAPSTGANSGAGTSGSGFTAAMAYDAGRGVKFVSEDVVKQLLAANVDPAKIGSLTCATCAVGLWLEVAGNKSITTQMTANETINGDSTSQDTHLRLIVWDSLVGTDNGNGGKYQPMQIDIPSPTDSSSRVTGTITNKTQVNLRFQDKYGYIDVAGNIGANSLAVTNLKFKNQPGTYQSSGTAELVLGSDGLNALYPSALTIGPSMLR